MVFDYKNCFCLIKINLVLHISHIYEVNVVFLAFLTPKLDSSVREFNARDGFVCPNVSAKLRLYCARNCKLLFSSKNKL
jgi:hypothetical protein